MSEPSIRDATVEDTARLLEIYAYYVEHTAITFEYTVPTLCEFTERMRGILARYPYLVIERDGVILGYAYAAAFRPRAAYAWACETTIYLDLTERRSGFGRQLYEELEKRLAAMGILNLYACIGYPETEDEFLTRNSVQFHAHLGYSEVGRFRLCGYKFNRWYHMVWMEKLIGRHRSDQPPVSFPDGMEDGRP